MRLVETIEFTVFRGSKSTKGNRLADALKVKGKTLFFLPHSPHFKHSDFYCVVCHHLSGRGDKVARFFFRFLQAYQDCKIPYQKTYPAKNILGNKIEHAY